MAAAGIDVHQHLWDDGFVQALRSRRAAPRLEGWTLHLDGQAPMGIAPEDHSIPARTRLVRADGLRRALVSLSAPLGVEWLPHGEAAPLLDAYHEGAAALPPEFGAWAAASLYEADAGALERTLERGFAGLQLPATALADDSGYLRCAPLLRLLEARGLPLFIHPGAAPPGPRNPAWWPALVDYVHQMHQAWFAFYAFGRSRHPRLRVCFALLAGLAPLHGERLAARDPSGQWKGAIDPGVFVETSSYGPRAVDAAIRVLGVDAVVYGTDRPYAGPPDAGDFTLGEAAGHAIRTANPCRLLTPARP